MVVNPPRTHRHVPGKGLSDRHRRPPSGILNASPAACGFCMLRDLAREPFERGRLPPGDAGAGVVGPQLLPRRSCQFASIRQRSKRANSGRLVLTRRQAKTNEKSR